MSKDRQRRHATKDKTSVICDRADKSICPAIVVGVGASSGALKSLKQLFAKMPLGHGVAFVLIQHLAPSQENLTVKLLKDQTALTVTEAKDGMEVRADRIHVIPPDKFLNITECRITLQKPVYCNGLRMPIDHFFCSLASDQQRRGCGIVLSGTGSDGTLGLSEIKAAGGRTLVEDPNSAEFPDMPRSAIDAGVVDAVLPADAMTQAIVALADQVIAETRREAAEAPEFDANLRAILDILRAKVGHDFRCYKPNTLVRRIRRRMTLGKMTTFADYARFLTEQPEEVGLLQRDLLISVTEFFRQPQAWEILEKKAIAPLVEKVQPGSEIRVWVPGCSTGMEAYSLAMLLTEQEEKSGKKVVIQIFATDSDAAALATARSGSYTKEEIGENVSSERLKRFFTRKDDRYEVIKKIREQVVFAPQNLTADPPFSRLDLISCRNLLIYLDQQVQKRIMALFHFALREGGFLFLGTAETVGDREDLFMPVSKKWRIYCRIGVGRPVGVEIPVRPTGEPQPAPSKFTAPASTPKLSLASAAQQMLLDRFAPACVMIDRKLQVLYVHGAVEDYLTFPAGELTTRIVDMAREGLRARLRGAIAKCLEVNRSVSITARVRLHEKSVPVKTTIIPLRYPRETDGLLLITFEDYHIQTATSRRQAKAKNDAQQLEDELKVTREELQSTIEQLESSNERLKVSNEEVTAANEELQSANEELETSKEELQSLNEELNTINARLQEKVDELEDTNNDIINLLSSTNIATVFLDKELKARRYTPVSTRLFSLIPSDVGRPIADVLRRFSDEALLDDARRVLADLTPQSREVESEDGLWYIRRITPYRTQDDRIEGVVITFVDVSNLKQGEEALRESEKRYRSYIEVTEQLGWSTNADGEVAEDIPSWRKFTGQSEDEVKGWGWSKALHPADLEHTVRVWRKAVATRNNYEVEYRIRRYDGVYRHFLARGVPIFTDDGNIQEWVGTCVDITERKLIEQALRENESRLNRAQEIAHLGSWELDLVNDRLTWSDEVYRIFGLQPQEFGATYDAFLEAVHPDDRAAVDAAYSGSIREGRDTYEIEHRVLRRANDEVRIVQEKCEHVRDESGRIIRSIGMVHDITERKRAEESLQQRTLELQQLTERLEQRVQERTAELEKTNEELEVEIAERKRAEEIAKIERQRLFDVLETLPVYVVLLSQNYHVPFANRFFRERFGESHGRCCFEYLFGRTEPCENCETYKVLKTNAPHHWEWTGPDGRIYDIFDFPFTDTDGSLLIMEMGIDITERKHAEEALRKLSSELLNAQEKERKMIAGEIHDSIGSSLAAIKFKVETTLTELTGNRPKAPTTLKSLIPIVQGAIDEARRIQMNLRPSMLDDLGILPTIKWLCRQFESTYSDIRVKQRIKIEEHDVPDSLKTVIFRVLQEGLNNVAKHSRAKGVSLFLRRTEHGIQLVIRDYGQGFDLSKVQSTDGVPQGLGLKNMRERTELSGGSFSLQSTEGKGTIVRASWPLHENG